MSELSDKLEALPKSYAEFWEAKAAAAAAAEDTAAAAAAAAEAQQWEREWGQRTAAAAEKGEKARKRRGMFSTSMKTLGKQLYDAASQGDTTNVLKSIEDGTEIEFQNPDHVSQSVSERASERGRQ